MAKSRPKLLIHPPPGSDPAEFERLLGDRYEIVVDPDPAARPDQSTDQTTGRQAPPEPGKAPELLFDYIDMGLCLCDDRGRVLFSNAWYIELDEVVSRRVASICEEAARRFAAGAGAPRELLRRFEIISGGESRWFEAQVSPAGEDRLAVSVRDVTRSGRNEQKMAAIERAGRELVRLEADTIRKMNSIERLGLLEDKIIRFAHDLLSFDHFAIRLIDEKTGKLELVISCGLSPEAGEFDLYPLPEGNGIAGFVAASGRSYICPDVSKDDRFLPALSGSQSSLVVPLHLHDKVIGVLDVESLDLDSFTDDDQRFAEMFSRYIALALHMLDLLVVERTSVNETLSGRVEGELTEPLEDILRETEVLSAEERDPEVVRHLARIKSDVDAIRSRVRNVASGPQTLLGVDRALRDHKRDPALVGRRILVADDATKIRRIISDVLRNRGATVVTCENGAVAITALEGADHFDLVISDIKMPDRNGYEVFAAARRIDPSIRVILMTGFGYDPHHSIVRASQEGLQSVLFKPFQVERLLDEVRKALTEIEAGAE